MTGGASRDPASPIAGTPLELRPPTPADEPFLVALLASTRPLEVQALGAPALVEQLFGMQREAQRRTLLAIAGTQEHVVVGATGEPIGRLVLRDTPEEIRLVDISLLPEHRNAGHGTALLEALQRRAAASGLPITLHVDLGSPAERFYTRLGFASETADDVRRRMRWAPAR